MEKFTKKVDYLDLSSTPIPKDVGQEFTKWARYQSHNNGYAVQWIIENPEDSAYPVIEQFFLDQGFETGHIIIVHSKW